MQNKLQHSTEHCKYVDQTGISDSERDHYSKVYGINRTSILCKLPNFDVTKQLPQDLMHVLLEGVFMVHVRELLKYLVDGLSYKRITLDVINCRILSHPYGYFEDKPAPLTSCDPHGCQPGTYNTHVNMYLSMLNTLFFFYSFSNVAAIFHILPFLVGRDFPPCNPYYECFMLLNDIATVLFSPVIAHDQIPFLKIQIHEYLERFTSLYIHINHCLQSFTFLFTSLISSSGIM